MSKNHWMMFGTFNEQRHFIYPSEDTYEGIFINANMAAHAPDGIAKFIQTKTAQQKYIIDPQTHAFQHNPKHIKTDILIKVIDEETGKETKQKTGEKKIKQSIEKLIEQYGEPVVSVAGKRPVTPTTFSNNQILKGFTDRCLKFQRDFISSRMVESEDSKYTSFEAEGEQSLSPYALIPPYFYMQETTYKNWLPVNMESIKIALKEKSANEKIFVMLVLSQGILTKPDVLKEVIAAYQKVPVDGYVIWVDDLAEFEAGSTELTSLLDVACDLNKKRDKEVINLHGSFFSVLATSEKWKKRSFTGVCHGPEFGEHRGVVPVGGGIPIARYYIPFLHQRIRYREAADFLREIGYFKSAEIFYENVCNCQECRNNIQDNPDENFILYGDSTPKKRKTKNGFVRIDYPKTPTKLHCLRHYLQRKNLEYKLALGASLESIRQDLQRGIEDYAEILGSGATEHLELWEQVLFKTLSQ